MGIARTLINTDENWMPQKWFLFTEEVSQTVGQSPVGLTNEGAPQEIPDYPYGRYMSYEGCVSYSLLVALIVLQRLTIVTQ